MKQRATNRRSTIIRTIVLTVTLIAVPHAGADYEAGQQAWDAGNVDEALSQWRDAANAGALAEESSPTPTADTSQPPPRAIRAAQSLLAALGYQPGPADGVWTSSTKAAYQTFLRDAGLPQAEALTPETLRTLQAVAEQQGLAQTGGETTTAGTAQTPAPPAPNAPPPVSLDALHHATQTGDIEILKAAIAAGVDVNARDSRGSTALMHATNKGYPLLVSLLLEAQADVNVRAPDGATALFMAAAHGYTEIIELLMKAGADVSIRGPQGKTPVEVAVTRYGDASTARENNESPALIALLAGKTWAKAEEDKVQNDQRIMESFNEMVSIPTGKFRMGSRKGQDNEKPVHRVTLPAFKLGTYEVTVGQFRVFVEATGYRTDGERNAGGEAGCYSRLLGSGRDGDFIRSKGWVEAHSWRTPGYAVSDNQPVVCVSWNDTQAFIDWLNKKTGSNYRLPTEAEWEYAARAGSRTEYSWGNDIGNNNANCYRSECGGVWEYTAPAGSFPANAWGLHDMHGNVWEWVQDCWNDNYEGAPTDGSARMTGDCGESVIRGAAWDGSPEIMRSALRYGTDRSSRSNYVGFRLAQDE